MPLEDWGKRYVEYLPGLKFLHISNAQYFFFCLILPEDMFSLLLEREEGREGLERKNINGREKHGLDAFYTCLKWGQPHNLGMCPDRT